MKIDKSLLVLFTPSWVSSLMGVVVGLGLTVGTIIASRFQGSQIQQELFDIHQRAGSLSTTSSYQTVTTNLAHNRVLNAAPLFILWAFIGLIVYYLATSIVTTFSHAEELREEMGYVHASRGSLLRHASGQFLIRLVALAAWFGFIKLSLGVILSYCLAASHIAAGNLASISNLGDAALAVIILFVDIYAHAVFIRLIALRPRVFSSVLLS